MVIKTSISLYESKRSTLVPLIERQLMEKFRLLDVNGDGVLCRTELKSVFETWGAWFACYRAHSVLDHADGNKDGYINKDEFRNLVKYASECGYTVK
ncbi:hypothetical protein ACOSQ3_010959 [Xanthoceras sorbifolium]